MRSLALVSFIGILGLGSANAQETQKYTFDIGAGFTNSVGGTATQLSNGWNIGAGAGYNFSPYLGAKLDLAYSSMDISGSTLLNIGVPGGDVHVFTATVDPVVHLTPKRHFDLYLTGGGGLFHIYQEFSQPVAGVANVFNPFFGDLVSSYSVNKPGFDVGGGVAFGVRGHGKVFAEAKWDHGFLSGAHIDYLPISFGFRW